MCLTRKRVTFSPVVVIHYLHVWEHAARLSRNGSKWIELAVDRNRFARRIIFSEQLLWSVLQQEHRHFIYETRFRD
jgi:hypothetical protein